MHTLCFDFGNTRLKLCFFRNDKLEEVNVMDHDGTEMMASFLEKYKPQKTILSSVLVRPGSSPDGTAKLINDMARPREIIYSNTSLTCKIIELRLTPVS